MEEPIRRAIGTSRPPALIRVGTDRLLRLLAWRTRHSPPRQEPLFVFGAPIPGVYPNGYTMDDIGPGDQAHLATTFSPPPTDGTSAPPPA